MRTPLCDRLGMDVPILCAPLGPSLTTPELVAAVCNAGGLGVLSFGALPAEGLRALIRRTRALTDRPFGVNFVLHVPVDEAVAVCIDEQVRVLSFFWGDVAPYVERVHRAGLLVMDQVGSVEAARRSAEAGVDVVVAQGWEAGGHVAGTTGTMALVPGVVDAVAPVPVVAAGGIACGRGLAAALALGAQGVAMGTRFLATVESAAHPRYKRAVLDATEAGTVYTTLFGRDWPAPHRVVEAAYRACHAAELDNPLPGEVIGEMSFGGRRVPLLRGASLPPDASATGAIEAMALLAGQSAGRIVDVRPAAAVVASCLQEARTVLSRLEAPWDAAASIGARSHSG